MSEAKGDALIITIQQLNEIRRLIEQLATTTGFGEVTVIVEAGHVRFFRVTHSIDAVGKGDKKGG